MCGSLSGPRVLRVHEQIAQHLLVLRLTYQSLRCNTFKNVFLLAGSSQMPTCRYLDNTFKNVFLLAGSSQMPTCRYLDNTFKNVFLLAGNSHMLTCRYLDNSFKNVDIWTRCSKVYPLQVDVQSKARKSGNTAWITTLYLYQNFNSEILIIS